MRLAHCADIVVVDDDPDVLEILSTTLERRGHTVRAHLAAEDALKALEVRPADLVIADVMLPGLSGVDLAGVIRDRFPDVAMLMITGYPDVDSARGAFRAGVTDYLTKPLSPERVVDAVQEALERRRAAVQQRRQLVALRGLAERLAPAPDPRAEAPDAPSERTGAVAVQVDLVGRVVRRNGTEVPLTHTEYELVAYLYRHRPRVLDPREIAQAVRGEQLELWEAREFCKSHVRNIRRKLESDPTDPVHLVNVYGRGYCWQ